MADETGTGDVSAEALTLAAAGVDGSVSSSSSVSASALTVTGSGLTGFAGTGSVSAVNITVEGGGIAGDVGLGLVSTRYVEVEGGGQRDDILLLEPVVDGAGVDGAITHLSNVDAAELTVSGSGVAGGVGAGDVDAQAPDIFAHEGSYGDVAVSVPDVVGAGVTGSVGSIDILTGKPLVLGAFSNNFQGIGTLEARSVDVLAEGVAQFPMSGAINVRSAQVIASGVAGSVGTADISVPLIQITSTGHSSIIGTASILLPYPTVDASGAQVLAVPYRYGVAVNTRIQAVSEYVGLNVRDVCNFSGMVLALSDDGIVAITGTTDNLTNINANVLSGVTDFKSTSIKKILTGYLSMKASGDISISLISDGGDEREYVLRSRSDSLLHVSKVRFGQGTKGRHWQWRLKNNGKDFEVRQLSLDTEVTTRRI